jgi:hypothetical protein
VQDAIERHTPAKAYARLTKAEAAEAYARLMKAEAAEKKLWRR